jgi:hypothetical protein
MSEQRFDVLECLLVHQYQSILIIIFGKFRGTRDEGFDGNTNSEVLIEVLLDNDVVRLVPLCRVDAGIDEGISICMTELHLHWLIKLHKVVPLLLLKLAEEGSPGGL